MELIRANKVTTYWGGNGVAVAVFYKTHGKLLTIHSDDVAAITAGFVMPESTEDKPLTAAEKLESFKSFVKANAAMFGISYDPVDRRDVSAKALPSQYSEENIGSYALNLVESALSKVLEALQDNVIAKMIAAGTVPGDTIIQYGTGVGVTTVTGTYNAGNIKYATVDIPVTIGTTTSDKTIETKITVELISGQLKKPRTIGDSVLTMTGIKNMLIEGGVLPKPEPKKTKSKDAEDAEDTETETEE